MRRRFIVVYPALYIYEAFPSPGDAPLARPPFGSKITYLVPSGLSPNPFGGPGIETQNATNAVLSTF